MQTYIINTVINSNYKYRGEYQYLLVVCMDCPLQSKVVRSVVSSVNEMRSIK